MLFLAKAKGNRLMFWTCLPVATLKGVVRPGLIAGHRAAGRSGAGRRQDRIQPRHSADSGRELLPLPWARQCRRARPICGSTTRQAAIEKEAIVPGKPDESELIARIFSDDADEQMPPARSHKKLTAEQKKLLSDWIKAGAEYQPHWSLSRRQRPALPAVKNAGWVRNPIDRFILAKLEKLGCNRPPKPTAARWPAG